MGADGSCLDNAALEFEERVTCVCDLQTYGMLRHVAAAGRAVPHYYMIASMMWCKLGCRKILIPPMG